MFPKIQADSMKKSGYHKQNMYNQMKTQHITTRGLEHGQKRENGKRPCQDGKGTGRNVKIHRRDRTGHWDG